MTGPGKSENKGRTVVPPWSAKRSRRIQRMREEDAMPELAETDDEPDDPPPPLESDSEPEFVPRPRHGARSKAMPKGRARQGKVPQQTQQSGQEQGKSKTPADPGSSGPSTADTIGDPRVYVLSVCDGIGGIFVAVSKYTSEIEGHACEKEQALREFVRKKWPKVGQSALIEELDVQAILEDIMKVRPDIVLMVGGVPCQPFSGLADDPRGMADPRAAPIGHFVRIRDGLSAHLRRADIDFYWMIEEVASMTRAHRDEISRITGTEPVLLHAADYGWIHRPRLYCGAWTIRHSANIPTMGVWSTSHRMQWPKTWRCCDSSASRSQLSGTPRVAGYGDTRRRPPSKGCPRPQPISSRRIRGGGS